MEQLNKTFMYKGKECNQDKKQTRGEMTKETLKNILAKPEYQTIHDLSLIGIDIFDNEGKFKGAEQITKDIADKINYLINNTCGSSEENTKGDEVMTNKYENREAQDGRVYLRDIIGNLIKTKEALIYEIGYATSKGLTGAINYLKQAALKLDIGICDLKNIDGDFEYKICEINKAIDALSEAAEKIQAANEIYFIRMEVIDIKDKIDNEIIKLKLFDETWNDKKVETTEIDPSVEEEKKENEGNENKKEETSEKDITTPIFKFDDEEMKEIGMYFSGIITPFCGIDFADANKESVSAYIVNPNITVKGNKVKNEVNGNEEVEKSIFDEIVLNENIETMRKEIKEIDSCALSIKPMEKAEIITKLSKEIRKCINVKNHI